MATNDETFVLVEQGEIWPADHQPCPENYYPPIGIKRLVRTYYGRNRADEDLALLRDVVPERRFDVQPVEHIDN